MKKNEHHFLGIHLRIKKHQTQQSCRRKYADCEPVEQDSTLSIYGITQ